MALTSQVTKPLPIPHEPGQEVTIRMLSWTQLEEARQRRTQRALAVAKDLGMDMLSQIGDASWWDVLGVERDASKDEIRDAYLKLAKVAHPDSGGDGEYFRRVKIAYERGMAAKPPKADGERDVLAEYDQETVLKHGLIAWTYMQPCDDANKADLDPKTAEWAAREICELSDPRPTDEERLGRS